MKALDRYLQSLRIQQAQRFLPPQPRSLSVLDIGCSQGELFQALRKRIGQGIGIDPTLTSRVHHDGWDLLPGCFPEDLPEGSGPFDVITALAVIEHIPMDTQPAFAHAAARLLKSGGRLILTVPSPRVDDILEILLRLHLIHGMSLEEHFGFDVAQVPALYRVDGLELHTWRKFELGLNHIFVFHKQSGGH